jgi:hypothetical protein
MRDHYTPHAEIEAHRHPVLPGSEHYRITRIQHDADLESGQSTLVLHLAHRQTGERRVLSFTGAQCDHLLAHHYGLYLLDIRHRGWESLRVEVGEFFEDGGVYFYAADVRDITHESQDAAA